MANTRKECFVVSAIGDEGSATRRHADWVLQGIIQPTFDAYFPDYNVTRADHMNTPGLIDAQIIDKLLNADLVIADLTFLNPNAFYEIGIRHVVAKPIIHINLATEKIPFDISLYLALKFSIDHPDDLQKAKNGLRAMIEVVVTEDYQVENPVTKARGRVRFEETATPVDRIIQTELANVSERLNEIEKRLRFKNESSQHRFWGLGSDVPAQPDRARVILRFEPESHKDLQGIEPFAKQLIRRHENGVAKVSLPSGAVEVALVTFSEPLVDQIVDMAKKFGLELVVHEEVVG